MSDIFVMGSDKVFPRHLNSLAIEGWRESFRFVTTL